MFQAMMLIVYEVQIIQTFNISVYIFKSVTTSVYVFNVIANLHFVACRQSMRLKAIMGVIFEFYQ